METLKNCPFDGSDKLMTKHSKLDDIGFCGTAKVWYVHCYGCQIRGPVRETKEQAEAAWNERKP